MKKQDESNKKKKIHVSLTGFDKKSGEYVIKENFISDEKFKSFEDECKRITKCLSEYYEQKDDIFDFFHSYKFTDHENVYIMSVVLPEMYYVINFIIIKGEK